MKESDGIILEAVANLTKSATLQARRVFECIDPTLDPRVVTVVIPIDSGDAIVVSPDNCNYDPAWFSPVRDSIADIPSSYYGNLAPDVQGVMWQERVAAREAITAILDRELESTDRRAFAAFPELAPGFCIVLVLEVNRRCLDSHYALPGESQWGYKVGTSFATETITAFLYGSVDPLKDVAGGASGSMRDYSGQQTLQSAGIWLMHVVEEATSDPEDEGGSDNAFHHLNLISAGRYEGSDAHGSIHIGLRNDPAIVMAVEFAYPIRLSAHRNVRKLLELTSERFSLIADSCSIYGLGELAGRPDPGNIGPFTVSFTGHYRWVLSHDGHDLMVVKYGYPELPRSILDESEFRKRIEGAFPGTPVEAGLMYSIVDAAAKQGGGTTIVFLADAASEARRLRAESTPVAPVRLDTSIAEAFASVDGAILVGLDGICHAFGAILDGMASDRGTSARGSRYNSAVRYVDQIRANGDACLAVIVSEDRTVDIV